MKKSLIAGIITFAFFAAIIGGTTMAWFNATAAVPDNEFVAGTVQISADRQVGVGQMIAQNWNPGDCNDLDLQVINNGTKSIYVRAKIDKRWLPNTLRVLVVYTGKTVQLLAVEWDSDGHGFTGSNGPVATGNLYVGWPSNQAYIDSTFTNLSNTDLLSNNTVYSSWCLDKWESIVKGVTYPVQIYDPLSNPDWYDEVDSHHYWENIPWEKIVYIINGDFLNRGYTSDEMQDAIWHYVNYMEVEGKALEIVLETEANWELSAENVSFNVGADWIEGTDGYFYYYQPVSGTYSGTSLLDRTIWFDSDVCLIGALTGNEYQGKVFNLTVFFEAVQSSNKAVNDAWPGNPYNLQ